MFHPLAEVGFEEDLAGIIWEGLVFARLVAGTTRVPGSWYMGPI